MIYLSVNCFETVKMGSLEGPNLILIAISKETDTNLNLFYTLENSFTFS